MKKICFAIVSALLVIQAFSQTPLNTFNKRTLYKYWDPGPSPTTLQQTTDRGYISCRASYDSVGGEAKRYFEFVKRDREGNTSWIHRALIGPYNYPNMMWSGLDAIQTKDGGYLGTYMAYKDSSHGEITLIKTDSLMNVVWTKKYPGAFASSPMQLKQTSDSGYVVAGYTKDSSGARAAYIFKTNVSGNFEWGQKCSVLGDTDACFLSVVELPGRGYVASGYTTLHALVVGFDNSGNIEWKKSFFNHGGLFLSVTKSSDDHIMVGGGYTDSASSWHSRMCIMKLDTLGSVVWQKGYDLNPNPYFGSNFAALVPVSGGMYFAGYLSDPIPGTVLGKMDLNGNFSWTKKYISTFHTFNYETMALATTTDGGLALDEFVGTFLNGQSNFSKELLKLDNMGDGGCDGSPIALSLSALGFLPYTNISTASCGAAVNYSVTLEPAAFKDSIVCQTINDHAPVGGIVANMHVDFKLGQNYPNPFSGETTISYTLPSGASKVEFEICDAVGACVARRKENAQPGEHLIRVSGLAPGLYCYSLLVDGTRSARKMLVE